MMLGAVQNDSLLYEYGRAVGKQCRCMGIHVNFAPVLDINSNLKTPSGYWQQIPQVSIAQTYLKIMNKFCEQFGLTPSARSRISTDSGEDKQNDEMELLLVKGGAG